MLKLLLCKQCAVWSHLKASFSEKGTERENYIIHIRTHEKHYKCPSLFEFGKMPRNVEIAGLGIILMLVGLFRATWGANFISSAGEKCV